MNPSAKPRSFFDLARATFVALGVLSASSAGAVQVGPYLDIPNVPFYIGQSVPPNVLLTLDDSGSMARAYVPDNLITYCSTSGSCSTSSGIAFKSSLNAMYYNPAITYRAPVDANNVDFTTTFTQAWLNGFATNRGSVNLSNNYLPVQTYAPDDTSSSTTSHCGSQQRLANGNCPGVNVGSTTATRAYYWTYTSNGTKAGGASCPSDYEGDEMYLAPLACFTFKQVAANEEQNFANWFSFYRTRNLAVVSSAILALKDTPASYRVGWQGLTTCIGTQDVYSTACRGWDTSRTTVDARVKPFTQTRKNELWSWLTRLPASSGTPLRQALDRSGRYLQTTGNTSPWADTFGDPTTGYASCRQSYSVMMTDGIWNGSGPFTNPGNPGSTASTMPDGVSYSPMQPYKDTNTDSVADIAFKYWATDLQPTLTNEVRRYLPYAASSTPTYAEYWDPRNDPATWQHMTSFFVGLGLTKTLRNPDWKGATFAGNATAPYTGYWALAKGTATWPAAGSDMEGNVHDLWHGAINSRGAFFSVDSPDALLDAFQQINNRIAEGAGASTAASASSFQVQTDSMVYTASFDTTRWDGTIRAFRVGTDGTPASSPAWTTDNTLDYLGVNKFVHVSNIVYVRNASGGLIKFGQSTLNQMNTTDKAALDAGANSLGVATSQLVNWLLGDDSNTSLRTRSRLLGDVLGSQPVFEGGRDYGYTETGWATPSSGTRIDGKVYADYVRKKSQGGALDKPTLYFGANDGMLHAINADTGARRWAFIPSAVIGKLWKRADTDYAHEYYVDGQVAIHDVHNGSEWRTVLVATLGAGAKGMFAMDITDPDAPSLLWEKYGTGADDGHVFGEPVIARAGNGQWIVAVGNGYGSSGNTAKLNVYEVFSGSLLKTLAPAQSAVSSAQGMSSPALLYLAGRILGFAYAGDWQGNLWRFNLQDANPANWTVDNGGIPLFQARNAAGNVQRITAKPRVISDRALGRVIVFGTGKLLELTDKDDLSVQTLYGVYDRASASTANRSMLTAQTITGQSGSTRSISTNAMPPTSAGWYLDLLYGSATGERIITPANYLPELSLILAATLQPAGGACDSTMNSALMALNPWTGAGKALLDVGGTKTTGVRTAGMVVAPSVVRSGNTVSIMVNRGQQGIELVKMTKTWNPRAAWRQLR